MEANDSWGTSKSPTGFQMLCMSLSSLYKFPILILTSIDFKRELTLYANWVLVT